MKWNQSNCSFGAVALFMVKFNWREEGGRSRKARPLTDNQMVPLQRNVVRAHLPPPPKPAPQGAGFWFVFTTAGRGYSFKDVLLIRTNKHLNKMKRQVWSLPWGLFLARLYPRDPVGLESHFTGGLCYKLLDLYLFDLTLACRDISNNLHKLLFNLRVVTPSPRPNDFIIN